MRDCKQNHVTGNAGNKSKELRIAYVLYWRALTPLAKEY